MAYRNPHVGWVVFQPLYTTNNRGSFTVQVNSEEFLQEISALPSFLCVARMLHHQSARSAQRHGSSHCHHSLAARSISNNKGKRLLIAYGFWGSVYVLFSADDRMIYHEATSKKHETPLTRTQRNLKHGLPNFKCLNFTVFLVAICRKKICF